MPCVNVNFGGTAAILNMAGPTRIISAGGTDFLFEFHEYCGPMMVGKRGDPIRGLPGKKSPFWDALYWWLKQGQRMNGNRCVFEWEMQPVQIMKQIGPQTFMVLGPKKKGKKP